MKNKIQKTLKEKNIKNIMIVKRRKVKNLEKFITLGNEINEEYNNNFNIFNTNKNKLYNR
jgi:hypothetical protein